MAYNRDKSHHSRYEDSDDDDRVTFFLPSEEIDFEVLASDLKCYLGNEARVDIGTHHKTGKAGYYIKSAVPVTRAMIQDLKADSDRWKSERWKHKIKDYNDSHTHRSRQKSGPSDRVPPAAAYRERREREAQDKSLERPPGLQPIPKSRHEQQEDQYLYEPASSASQQYKLTPRTTSQYPVSIPSRPELATYDPQGRPRSSQNYPAPMGGPEYASRRDQEDTLSLSAGGISVNYRQTESSAAANQAGFNLTPSDNQYPNQSRYTKRQIQEVEAQIQQLLRDRGHTTVSRQDFDRLVNEQLARLYDSQQQQYQSTQLSSGQGGQKPPSGSVPYSLFPESGGYEPTPGSIPFTQFSESGHQKPPHGSVPYNQFPGSDGPPQNTQPDYGGSYGFKGIQATSGAPQSDLLQDSTPLSTDPTSQSYKSNVGKHRPRDDYKKRR